MATISVCMIVRDEESCLADALESVKGADEIVICDTGSTDNTIEIARKYTDKVFTDYKWNDNFAEARNHAASKCTKDYILILDADEELQKGALEYFKTFTGTALSVKTESKSSGHVHSSIRLYKNIPEIRWYGAAHNYLNIEPSHVSGYTVFYGYSPAHYNDPDRTLRILTKQYESGQYTSREVYYLAIEYMNRHNAEQAIQLFNEYVQMSRFNAEKADAYMLMSRLLYTLGQSEGARRAALEAFYINPDFGEAAELLSRVMPTARQRMKWQRIQEGCENTDVLFKREEKRIRVTMLCEEDFAGSGYQIVKAAREANPMLDIEMISVKYPAFGHESGTIIDELGKDTTAWRIQTSDVIHFKGDFAYPADWHGFYIPETAATIYTVGGSFFRRGGHKSVCFPRHELSEYKADLLTALTKDLFYSDDWQHTPHAWNKFENTYQPPQPGEKIRIVHVPSDTRKKGTDTIDKAMQLLMSQRDDIEYIRLTGLTAPEALEAKRTAHLYIDQLNTGSYGLSAVEAMSCGVPVACNLTEAYEKEGCPVIYIPTNPAMIAEVLNTVCNTKLLSYLSDKSYEYAQRVHGSQGQFWADKYFELTMKNKNKYKDIKYKLENISTN